MALPVLKLNLVPAPTLWRQHHGMLGWSGLVVGLLALAGSLAAWVVQETRTRKAVRESTQLSLKAQQVSRQEAALKADLATLDITAELPRWRLAERIYLERGLPWSRATAELERSLVDGVRIKALARARGADGTVELKLRGDSRTREAEAAFIENLQKNGLFSQVVLEREAERQGGGLEVELRLPMVATPPPYQLLPRPEPAKAQKPPAPTPLSPRTGRSTPLSASPSKAPSASGSKEGRDRVGQRREGAAVKAARERAGQPAEKSHE